MIKDKRSQDESRTKLSALEIKNLAEKVTDWKIRKGSYYDGGHDMCPGSEIRRDTITFNGEINGVTIGAYCGKLEYFSWARLKGEGREPIELGSYSTSYVGYGERLSEEDVEHVCETYKIAERKYNELEQAREKIKAELKAKQEAIKRNVVAEAVKTVRKILRDKK